MTPRTGRGGNGDDHVNCCHRRDRPVGQAHRRGVAAARVLASQIVATGRNIAGIKDLAERGVVVRRADFADPDSLATAFAGADRLLLVSTTTVDERLANHRHAIDAAIDAGCP
ncbi:NmrA family NAD(P)-binding protein [Streptomyces sp. M19]